jgi:hypothetical protein
MVDFLVSHEMYGGNYSHNMKVYKFSLPDNSYDMLEMEEVRDSINMLIEDWSYNWDYTCYFGGRSGGHAVLHRKNSKRHFSEEDPQEMEFSELKDKVKIVQEFDKLCDDIVDSFRCFCENYTITKDEVGEKIFIENRLLCPVKAIQDGERPW